MEVYSKQGRFQRLNDGLQFTHQNKAIFSLEPQIPCLRKQKSFKSQASFSGSQKSRLRRLNSIEGNLTNLFKQNQSKISLYLNSQHSVPDMVTLLNLENPEIFTILQDGVYVLIRGSVKMITFCQQKPMTKNIMKQIVGNVFRKLRITKQLGETRSRDQHSEHVKKYFVNEKSQEYYNLASFEQPFTVFETVNQNCLTFTNDTIMYNLDDQERRVFKYYQNKDQVSRLLEQNVGFFKNHSMLYHTFTLKRFSFRNQIKVQNVAVIKRGTLKVYAVDQSDNVDKENVSLMNSTCGGRKLVCQLSESSLLVKGFTYQISSHEADVLFIQNNATFQFIRNPDWVRHFYQSQREKKKSMIIPRQLNKKSLHATLRQQHKRQTLKKSSMASFLPHFQQLQTDMNKSSTKLLQRDRNAKINHSKTCFFPSHEETDSQVLNSYKYNYKSMIKCNVSQLNRKTELIRMMQPYIIISQKIGLKELMDTRSVLNEKSVNMSAMNFGGKLQRINKISKSGDQNIKKTWSSSKAQNNFLSPRTKPQRSTLVQFQKFLKNHQQYKKQVDLGKKPKPKSSNKGKPFRGLTPIPSSTFHPTLKKIPKIKPTQNIQTNHTNKKSHHHSKLQVQKLTFQE